VVDALLTFDDGGGAKLYAGGWFTKAGGVSAYHIAKWNGATWASAGGLGGYAVLALAEFDDGTGPALYAGDGPIGSNYVSKWNGATWTIVSAVDSSLYALAAYDDGSGRSLYAGGDFDVAGQGVVAPGIARWYGPPCPGP